ncbi:SdrD B-like domain-containing protein, partial [Clostridium sp.]|uniref:SdrD B-like domain-containing protein n=1 Tax=Clostridium sp. TaxID=1506 RepID=UPI003F417E47
DEIPQEIKPTRIRTPEFWIAPIETSIPESYTIEYQVNNSGPFIPLGIFNTNSSQIVTLPDIVKITKIKYNIGNLPVGATQDVSFIVDGEVISTNPTNLIVNKVTLEYDEGPIRQTKESTVNTQVNNLSYLNISKSRLTNQAVIPGNIVKYRLTVPANRSQINNPRIIDILDENLTYVGNEFYSYYDYFSGTTITSNNPGFPLVTKQVIPNYNNTNKTLVRYELDNFSIQQRGVFYVDFEASVNVGALGPIPNNSYLGNSGPYGYAPGGLLDTNDLDKDNITNENLAISNTVNLNALLFAGLKSDKKVKGELDSVFTEEPNKGKTYEGGIVEYKLEITNIGNVDITSIEIVDILPHVGDTGVILTNSPRDSDFAIYSVKDISATLSDSSQIVDLKVEYSQSYDPVRFSATNFGNDTIGTVNDWTQLPPNPIVNTKSFKVTTLNNVLKPNSSIIVSVKCIAPVGVNLGEVAWNSFAIKGSYLDLNNNLKYLTPVEPEKVGVEILNVGPIKVCIEGFAFLDKNLNGKFDNTDEGLNGVIIELYDENFNLVKDTITTNNASLQPGYYIFNNIDVGNYYIKFIKPQGYQYTIKVPGGDSKIDPITGFTPLIVANTPGQCVTNIGGGFVIPNWAYIILNVYNINILEFCCEDNYCEFLNDLSDKIYILLDIIQKDLELESSNFVDFNAEIERLICKLDELKAKYYSFVKDCPNDDKYYGEYLCEISRMLINLMAAMQYYYVLKENLKLNPYYSYYKCILCLFSNQIDLL